ncbi:DNA polymerase IV [Nitrospirota bacterium]
MSEYKTGAEGRVVICVDMDAFFASVEQQTNPKLRGKPIAVIGSGGRTVVTTSSYEARAFGVKTGMNVYEARQACPRIIFVVGNNARYTHTCTELTKLYERFTPEIEVYSVDEAFMDITHSHHLFGGPEAIARKLKRGVHDAFGINCTVGIGPNVLLAKLASDLGKPNGLKWIREEIIEEELEHLEVDELWGIGRKTTQKLNAMGIKTCGQLGRTPASLLRNKFGIYGERLKGMGLGQCNRPVQMDEAQAKSVGHSMTLPRDIWERRDIEAYLLKLSEMVGRRARRHGLMGRKATLVVRYADFETFTRRCTLPAHTNDTHVLYCSALRELTHMRLRTKVRLLGISLHSLVADPGQLYLMEDDQKRRDLLDAMDEVNDRFGDFKLTWASHTTHSRHSGVISPAWRPGGVKNIQLK